jgi:hypothetical protein
MANALMFIQLVCVAMCLMGQQIFGAIGVPMPAVAKKLHEGGITYAIGIFFIGSNI